MKVVIDDTSALLRQLVNLYELLPEELRTSTTEDIIPASELICQATE